MKNKFLILYTLLVGLVALILFLCNDKRVQPRCGVVYQNFCGTQPQITSEEGKLGKKLFNANCAACHKLDKHMTGPALRGIHARYIENKLSMENFLKGKRDSLLFKEMFDEMDCIIFPQLSLGEIKSLEAYIQ